jgi:hypothetical protein
MNHHLPTWKISFEVVGMVFNQQLSSAGATAYEVPHEVAYL